MNMGRSTGCEGGLCDGRLSESMKRSAAGVTAMRTWNRLPWVVGMVLAGGVFLGGCNNALEGGLSGAAIGAGSGAAIGALTGGGAATGAAVGAIAGGVGGAIIGDQNERRARSSSPAY